MANGFSVLSICEKKIMELGSITNSKEEKVFLLSTTHGAEMNGLSAFIETVNFQKNNVIKHNWSYGAELINGANQISKSYGISEFFQFFRYSMLTFL